MKEEFSSARWAIDITRILNAIPDYDRFPVIVRDVATEISKIKFPDDPITLIKGKDLPGFEGAMKKAPTGKKGWGIFYNSGIRSKGRINFTLAHEFGHYLLHRFKYPDGFMCSIEDMKRWDSEYGILEGEANKFAADLLMPADDFRKLIQPKIFPCMELISNCAKRYDVSLMAAILKWLKLTSKRAVLVTSVEGYILWARSSEKALKSGLYFKTQNRAPIALHEKSLASNRSKILTNQAECEHDHNVWLNTSCREQVIFADNYDFAMSLLFFDDHVSTKPADDAGEEDTYDRFQRWSPD